MLKKLIYTLVLVCISGLATAQSEAEKVGLDLMREFDPQSYSYYQYNDGIKTQGRQIAQSIAWQISYYANLTATDDPKDLINDFNNKMKNIDLLEKDLEQQSTDFLNNQASEMGDQLGSGDYRGAINNFFGSLDAYSEMKEAQKKLDAQRQELAYEKQAKLNAIYAKKVKFTKIKIGEFRQRAAFTEDEAEETYYLDLADYMWCTLTSGFCTQPEKPSTAAIQNKFIAKDAVLKNIADRKFRAYKAQSTTNLYVENGREALLDGAIAFAAKAAVEYPTARNYLNLAELQVMKSSILAYTSLAVAEELDPSIIKGSKQEFYDDVKLGATAEIDQALKENNTNYLDAFLKGGLDKTIRFNGKSLLVRAISLDNADAVQLILNHYIEGLSQDEINKKVQKAIMLCAAQNSPNTLKRFIKLGVPVGFELGNFTPISIAAKLGAPETFKVLLNNSTDRLSLEKKYSASAGYILLDASQSPSVAAKKMEMIPEETLNTVVSKLLHQLNKNENYYQTYLISSEARQLVMKDNSLQQKLNEKFIEALIRPGIENRYFGESNLGDLSVQYLKDELVPSDQMYLLEHFINPKSLLSLIIMIQEGDFISLSEGFIPLEYTQELCNESLAFIAYRYNNIGAYKWLDDKFDFAQVKNKYGKTLIESMDNKPRAGYISDDFNVEKVSIIDEHLDKLSEQLKSSGSESPPYWPPISYIESYHKVDIPQYRSPSGGTLFHEYVLMFLKYKFSYSEQDIYDIKREGVDKSLKNNDGKTALDIVDSNEEKILKILEIQHKDSGMAKKLAKIQFKKMISALK